MSIKYVVVNSWDSLNEQEKNAIVQQSSDDLSGSVVNPRLSIDGTKALLKMNENNAPAGASVYSEEQMLDVIKTNTWSEDEENKTSLVKVRISREFGISLLDEFGAENTDMVKNSELSQSDIASMLTDADLARVKDALQTGSLITALSIMQTMGEKTWISPERKNLYISKIQSFLAGL